MLEKLIEVNISGRVFTICRSREVVDPSIISHYTDILRQAVWTNLGENCTLVEFNQVLEQQAAWLESEIDQAPLQTGGSNSDATADAATPASKRDGGDTASTAIAEQKGTGYVPKAKTMPERLADHRANIAQLLKSDCVALRLISPARAKLYNRMLLAQDPKKAEQEIVAELRDILHAQLRKFIRKHKGGPWGTATLQHELRKDVLSTRTLRSLVTLSRELYLERVVWLKHNKVSLTDRLFGGMIRFNR